MKAKKLGIAKLYNELSGELSSELEFWLETYRDSDYPAKYGDTLEDMIVLAIQDTIDIHSERLLYDRDMESPESLAKSTRLVRKAKAFRELINSLPDVKTDIQYRVITDHAHIPYWVEIYSTMINGLCFQVRKYGVASGNDGEVIVSGLNIDSIEAANILAGIAILEDTLERDLIRINYGL